MYNLKYLLLLAPNLISLYADSKMDYKSIENNKSDIIKVKDDKSFDIFETKDKLSLFFYIDPDERDKNESVKNMIEKLEIEKKYDANIFHCYVIINMGATSTPNFILENILKNKQDGEEHITYVKDLNKSFVKKWGLSDDSYNILLINKENQVIFNEVGEIHVKKIKKLKKLILANLPK